MREPKNSRADPAASSLARSGPASPAILQPVRWHARLLARLIWLFVNLLASTIRWRFSDQSGVRWSGDRQGALFVIWHNRLALCLIAHRRFIRQAAAPQRRLAALVSASRDGGMLARVLELFGVLPIRGSSSRRGAAALRELVGAARAGHDLALTPDGPRGPLYVLQPGVIAAAQLTGLPIVPAVINPTWKKSLRTWDRFQIPLPFTRCDFVLGDAIRIPNTATEAERGEWQRQLEATLRSMTRD